MTPESPVARDQLYLYHMLNGPQSTKPPWNSAERNLVNTPVPQSRGELLLVDGDQNCFMLLCELCVCGGKQMKGLYWGQWPWGTQGILKIKSCSLLVCVW